MIRRLNYKDAINFYEFILRIEDKYEDFYITQTITNQKPKRIFIKDLKLIEKILKYHTVYAVEEKEIKGIIIILAEKNFRPYIKILVEKLDYAYNLLKYIDWNFSDKELFIKIKKNNPICKILNKKWQFLGDRGLEVLYIKNRK